MPSRLDKSPTVERRRQRAGEILSELLALDERRFVRIAAYWLNSKQSAEDVVQAAAIAFIQSFDPDVPGNGRAYFIAAVRTHAWKANRTAARRRPENLTDNPLAFDYDASRHGPDPSEYVAELDAVQHALDGLSDRERQVVALKALGYGSDEVAELLSISDRAQRKATGRGRARLRTELDHE